MYKMNKNLDREKLQARLAELEEFQAQDDAEVPAWTFLLKPVIDEYGICPFLDHRTEKDLRCIVQRRMSWLSAQKDQGAVYHATVSGLRDVSELAKKQKGIEDLREEVHRFVQGRLEGCPMPHELTLEDVVTNLRQKKENKSQNKRSKEVFAKTVTAMDFVMMKHGIDLSKFALVHLGYPLRSYKAPAVPHEVQCADFENLCASHQRLCTDYNSKKIQKERSVADAKEQLAFLIETEFHVDQTGKYFKRWSHLTDEKKHERIRSYCEWFMRSRENAHQLADAMSAWVITELRRKELRSSDIVWNFRLGYITHINIVYNETLQSFERGKRPILKKEKVLKKSLLARFLEYGKSPEEAEKLLQRTNRLLLHGILSAGNADVPKDVLVNKVLAELHPPHGLQMHVLDHMFTVYDGMTMEMEKHVMPC